jgi:hypothetical protein
MSYIFITEPYISSHADIDVLLAIWRSGALHYYNISLLGLKPLEQFSGRFLALGDLLNPFSGTCLAFLCVPNAI